jgi:hypothetical protein
MASLPRAEALARRRDATADDAAPAPFGDADPVDWSIDAVRAHRARLRQCRRQRQRWSSAPRGRHQNRSIDHARRHFFGLTGNHTVTYK